MLIFDTFLVDEVVMEIAWIIWLPIMIPFAGLVILLLMPRIFRRIKRIKHYRGPNLRSDKDKPVELDLTDLNHHLKLGA